MPEAPGEPAAPSRASLLARATSAIEALEGQLVCEGCARPFGRARPWRSAPCAHTICAGCAAVARGHLGPHVVPSPTVRARAGHCPVPSCRVPVRPAELVEDVTIRAVLDAGARLADWARLANGLSPRQ